MRFLLALCLIAGLPSARPQQRTFVAVALSARDSVALFDAQTLERVATLGVGKGPHEIAATPDARRAIVADAGAHTLTVIDFTGPRPRVSATWQLPDSMRIHDVAVSPDGSTVWGAEGFKQLLVEIDARNGAVRRRIPMQRNGGWMVEANGPPGAEIIVAHLEGGAITLVNASTGVQRVLVGEEGEIDGGVTADGRRIWSVNIGRGFITEFDIASGAILNKQVAPRPSRLRFLPDGNTAFIVSDGDSTANTYDIATFRKSRSVKLAATPKVLAVTPDGRRAFITHPQAGKLSVVDIASMTLIRTIELPGTPDGVTVIRTP